MDWFAFRKQGLALMLAALLAAGSVTAQQTGTFTDGRDGQKYKTAKIGKQTWMAENLRFKSSCPEGDESICLQWCYGDKESNCKKYGSLYDWNTAMAVCPKGWHLPSNKEWTVLVTAAGSSTAGKKLKSKSGWDENGNGTDEYGFSALPGGLRYTDGSFGYAGKGGYWWAVTEGGAYSRDMGYERDSVNEDDDIKGFGFSVRCVADT